MRAVGYVRVSTDEQAREGCSLDNQEARIRAYAESQEWELVEMYREEGFSGKTTDLQCPPILGPVKLQGSALGCLTRGPRPSRPGSARRTPPALHSPVSCAADRGCTPPARPR
jgi:hypothetical protein